MVLQISVSLAGGAKHRPPSEYHQHAEVGMKRLPPKIILPSFGRKPSVDSCNVVCYIMIIIIIMQTFV